MIFIELENAYGQVSRNAVEDIGEERRENNLYSSYIQDMYEGVINSVRTLIGETKDFSIGKICIMNNSTLSHYLFNIIMNVLRKGIQNLIHYCMLFFVYLCE